MDSRTDPMPPSGTIDCEAWWIDRAERERLRAEGLAGIVHAWGTVLLNEGRLTVNDVRRALTGDVMPPQVRSHPVLADLLKE